MRVKRGFTSRRKHKAVLKMAKGYRGRRKSCYKLAKLAVEKGLQYSYRDRRVRKRDFRGLWIVRINAAVRNSGMSYSKFMRGLKLAGVDLNRKVLADLAYSEPTAFSSLVETAKRAIQ
jgi:large subunit ribosomal protein L20